MAAPKLSALQRVESARDRDCFGIIFRLDKDGPGRWH
jgi:hypothetical protein